MSILVINDLSAVEEISDEMAASIYAGRYRQLKEVREMEASMKLPDPIETNTAVPGGDSGGLYPGLGNQVDNVTPIFMVAFF